MGLSIEGRDGRVDADVLTDPKSGALSRAGWERALVAEEHRHRRYGVEEAAVLCVRLSSKRPTAALARKAATVLSATSRESDVVARVGPADFCVLVLRCPPDERASTARRYERALAAGSVDAAITIASVPPAATLTDAWRWADNELTR